MKESISRFVHAIGFELRLRPSEKICHSNTTNISRLFSSLVGVPSTRLLPHREYIAVIRTLNTKAHQMLNSRLKQ